jgi:hypothetical protein
VFTLLFILIAFVGGVVLGSAVEKHVSDVFEYGADRALSFGTHLWSTVRHFAEDVWHVYTGKAS